TIDNCRLENNVNYGIQVQGSSRVTVTNTQVNATGYRIGAAGQSPVATGPAAQVIPDPGDGIEYESGTSGYIAFTTVTGSFGAGISNEAGQQALQLLHVVAFDNNPDFDGVNGGSGAPPPGQQPSSGPCPAGQPSSPRPSGSFVPTQDCQGWVTPDHPLARR
ncbi:MAG: right-handed parallel beta-helix repeat-containing protein, partial [Vicinamibacterales bacterium]